MSYSDSWTFLIELEGDSTHEPGKGSRDSGHI